MRDSSAFAREHETVGLAAASSPKLSQRMDARSLLADQIIETSDRSHGDVWVDRELEAVSQVRPQADELVDELGDPGVSGERLI